MSNAKFAAHGCIAEPSLSFHPERTEDRHNHPLIGLTKYGPYSRSLIQQVYDPIRVAFVVPAETGGKVRVLFNQLGQAHQPRERAGYLVEYPGFERIFGLRLVAAAQTCWRQLDIDAEVANSSQPHLTLAERLTEAINSLQVVRSSFDVLLVYLPNRWEAGFEGTIGEDFDLHDYLKATTAAYGIPTQIVRESTMDYRCRASVMWRLSTALYCKAGGVPWKLADADPETAFIGLSYALHPQQVGLTKRFVTCCSQIFDADGAGLQFLTYDADDVRMERDNPFLNRSEMLRVMSRSLQLYQQRHAGRLPRRIVVHKSTEFKEEEVTGCLDAFKSIEEVELLHVQESTSWRGINIERPRAGATQGEVGGYPCLRGTYVPIGTREILLWTQGDAPTAAVGRAHFYKEGKGIPSPLLIKRYAGHGGWERTCQELLSLTKMNWNNDSLYDRLPVTLAYASVLARTVKRMPHLSTQPHEFRFFM